MKMRICWIVCAAGAGMVVAIHAAEPNVLMTYERRGRAEAVQDDVQAEAPLKFMTFNIWGEYFGNPAVEREAGVRAAIVRERPDVVAFQEADVCWWEKAALFKTMLAKDHYDIVKGDLVATLKAGGWTGRDLKRCTVNPQPLAFNRDRLELIDSGLVLFHARMSDKGATWAVLCDRITGFRFIAFSTHFWYQWNGEESDALKETNATALMNALTELKKKYPYPIIGGGDLNSLPGSWAHDLLEGRGLARAADCAATRDPTPTCHGNPKKGADGKWHGNPPPAKGGSLDHVFVETNGIRTIAHKVVVDADVLGASDHSPVTVTFAPAKGEITALWRGYGLEKAPQEHPAPAFCTNGVKASFFDSVPWYGKPTRFFAYYALPKGASKEKPVPAVVLVHGGGGTAFWNYVKYWNDKGYAAISMDNCGSIPVNEPGKPGGGEHSMYWCSHAWSGPRGWETFREAYEKPEDQWPFHAVATVILSHSFLRSLPEVDASRIGISGVSWGGYLTCIAASVDHRYRWANPVYGCGFLGDNSIWKEQLVKLGDKGKHWLALWDPSEYLPQATCPFLWVSGQHDFAYPIDSLLKSAALVKRSYYDVPDQLNHGHDPGFYRPSIVDFAAAMNAGKDFPENYPEPYGRVRQLAAADYRQAVRPLVRFGMVADVHHSYRKNEVWNGGMCYRLSKARLEDAVRTFAARRVDFVVELGDFKDLAFASDGKPDAVATARLADEIESVFAQFPGSRYHVLGNHEMDILSKEEILSHFTNTGFARSEPYYAFEKGGVTFIVLDACYNAKLEPYVGTPCNWDWTDANVPPEELAWLTGELARAEGPVVVFIHQRLDSAARPGHRVRNAEAVQRVLEGSGKVLGVFQGHDHIGGFVNERGINYYTLPATVMGKEEGHFAEVAVYPSGRVTVTGFAAVPSVAWRGNNPPRAFENPVGFDQSPDPFVTWDAERKCYYLMFTIGCELRLYRAPTLAGLRDGESVEIGIPGEKEGFFGNFWAPEMHRAPNGRWYVYSSGSIDRSSPWGPKRLFVLESKTGNPFDGFVYRGKPAPDTFAIDPTVTTLADGRRLVCYSEVRQGLGQVLVVRELVNPWTFGAREVMIGKAELPWELKDARINEGAFFVRSPDGGRLFVVYSGNGCFCDDYALGVIEYTGGDLYDPANWKKHPQPILVKGNGVFGPGHASFFRGADGHTLWCAYHGMKKSNPRCAEAGRWLNFQRVTFDSSGFPQMGVCIGSEFQEVKE